METTTIPDPKERDRVVRRIKAWQKEKRTNKYGMADLADRAIRALRKYLKGLPS